MKFKNDIFENIKDILLRANEAGIRRRMIEKSLKEEKDKLSKEIAEEMDRLGLKKFEFVTDEDNDILSDSGKRKVCCYQIVPKKIKYIPGKVYELFDKRCDRATRDKVVKKTYIIPNMKLVAKLLKKYGVERSEFEKLLYVKKEVDERELEKLYSLGLISIEDLEGCYTVDEGNPYWHIKASEESSSERNDT